MKTIIIIYKIYGCYYTSLRKAIKAKKELIEYCERKNEYIDKLEEPEKIYVF